MPHTLHTLTLVNTDSPSTLVQITLEQHHITSPSSSSSSSLLPLSFEVHTFSLYSGESFTGSIKTVSP